MTGKATIAEERIGRVGRRPSRDPAQDVREPPYAAGGDFVGVEQGAVAAEREMKQGKYVTLAQLHHDLERKNSRRSRKTA